MSDSHLAVLLAEDDLDTACFLQEIGAEAKPVPLRVTHVRRLSAALQALTQDHFDVVLVDLVLPDSHGLDTLRTLHSQVPSVPIVVLTDGKDDTVTGKIMQAGAQDCLVKAQAHPAMVLRMLRYAVERHMLMQELHTMSPSDPLTGFYNRQSFVTLAAQQIRYARRYKQSFVLLVMILENLKQMNDLCGRHAGDRALCSVAEILQETFRQSDILARLGGRTFAVMALQAYQSHAELCVARVSSRIQERNTRGGPCQALRLSIKSTWYDPDSSGTLYELLQQAGIAMAV